MMNLNVMMDCIDSSRVDVAMAISLGFADGDEEKAKKYFPYFLKKINECKIFVFKSTEKFFESNVSSFLFASKFSYLHKNYNVKSIKDILDFYKEVCSCLVDTCKLSEAERLIVEENKNNLISRVQNDSLIKNQKKLKKLKIYLENLYEKEYVKYCLSNSNLDDFFVRHNIEVTKRNLRKVLFLYSTCYTSSGFNTKVKFDEETFNVSIFRDKVLKTGYLFQNEIIIHELIHSLEIYDNSGSQYPFNDNCYYLNEAITQYFTLKSLEYLKKNVIEEETNKGKVFNCSYNSMLPMLKVLKNSPLWEDLLYCKFNNDYSLFMDRVGVNAKKISKIFDRVYRYKNSDLDLKMDKIDEACYELEEIVQKIVKTNKIYNKKNRFINKS